MLIDYRTGETTAKSHRCRVCQDKSALVVAWSATANSYELRCGLCGGDDLERRKSITQMWREDPESVDIATANRLADKHSAEIEEVAAGLPPELGQIVRERFQGLPIPTRGEE